jgi:hypothetical protein
VPNGRWDPPDSAVIAARLVELLPSRVNSNAWSIVTHRDVRQMICSLPVMWLICAAVFVTLFISANPGPSGMIHTDMATTNAAPLHLDHAFDEVSDSTD